MKRFQNRNISSFTFVIFLSSLLLFVIFSVGCNSQATLTVDVTHPGVPVSPICRGQQLEEFNYQFEGGLYAQLIHNPSFEEIDTKFNITPLAYWDIVKPGSSDAALYGQTSAETSMLNNHQQHCLKMEVRSVASGKTGLANRGYWGIKLENNTIYKVSFWAKCSPDYHGTLTANLENINGSVYAQSEEFSPGTSWKHFTCSLKTSGIQSISGNNRFVIYASTKGTVFFDVITLMPPTWKDRPNGLRPDLAEKLNALKLKFIQFPGGCTSESASMDKCWTWKNSIGPLEERPGSTRNRWWYKNDLYFGLDEYLQLCEDLGAKPLYTTSAGIDERPNLPDWYALCPIDKMQPIIDDILDLIQYCNGPVTTKWGASRAANGHPEPYNLEYIEIGNENYFTVDDYNTRYAMIYKAVKTVYPEIKIMYNGEHGKNGPSHVYGNPVDFTDEHFYRRDLSDMYNAYDSIDPECKRICIAEYATSVKGNGGDVIGCFGDALSDAAFMLGCEKNSERIWWTGYGNYAGLVGHGNFGPCIVWNDAVSCFATPAYYMQKTLFSDNMGTRILPFTQVKSDCFWSTSIDTELGRNDILIKAVNTNTGSETVNISLKGIEGVYPEGISSVLKGEPGDENSLSEPEKIKPEQSKFIAGKTFRYSFPAHSITVLRIHIHK